MLAAIAEGNTTRGGIASYIGGNAADIGRHLNVLGIAGCCTVTRKYSGSAVPVTGWPSRWLASTRS
jgi:hypothetical protein